MHTEHPELERCIERLKGITGFISILGDDPRIEAFKRYHHVMRAARVAEYMCERFSGYNRDAVLLVTYLHDINRLPFAHNLEKRINFDQAGNLKYFCRHFSLDIPQSIVASAEAVINKELDGPPLSKLVYTADAALGFIEDLIFAIVALNVPVDFIPAEVLSFLGFQNTPLQPDIDRLKHAYGGDIRAFIEQFNECVVRRASDLIDLHSRAGKMMIELPAFPKHRQLMKEEFLRKKVFPINNEQVSHGSRLAEEVAIPYMKLIDSRGGHPILTLLSMTDQELLAGALDERIIKDASLYYPSLP